MILLSIFDQFCMEQSHFRIKVDNFGHLVVSNVLISLFKCFYRKQSIKHLHLSFFRYIVSIFQRAIALKMIISFLRTKIQSAITFDRNHQSS